MTKLYTRIRSIQTVYAETMQMMFAEKIALQRWAQSGPGRAALLRGQPVTQTLMLHLEPLG